MDAGTMNRQLRALYEEHWTALSASIPDDRGYSAPLLLWAEPGYAAADIRLLVVGQQTNTWWGERGWDDLRTKGNDPVGYLMARYEQFNLGRGYRGSPFWRAAHSLVTGLASGGRPCGLIWSNLNRVDSASSKKDPNARPHEIEATVGRVPLLEREIQILQPHVVVFFTGPRYDARIHSTFDGVQIHDNGRRDRPFGTVSHARLPKASFRTYHPQYLQRRKLVRPALEEMAARALDALASG